MKQQETGAQRAVADLIETYRQGRRHGAARANARLACDRELLRGAAAAPAEDSNTCVVLSIASVAGAVISQGAPQRMQISVASARKMRRSDQTESMLRPEASNPKWRPR